MDGALFLTSASGLAISIDMQTGGERWRIPLGEGAALDTWSMSAAAGTVLAATAGGVMAGERRMAWREAQSALHTPR